MDNTDHNYTDNLFRQGLSSPPELNPTDKNWEDMESLLAKKAKRHTMAWIYAVSGVAAAILIFLSLWFAPETTDTATEQAQKSKNKETVKDSGNKINPDADKPSTAVSNPYPDGALPDSDVKLSSGALKGRERPGISEVKNKAADTAQAPGGLQLASAGSGQTPINPVNNSTIRTSLSGSFASQRKIELADFPEAPIKVPAGEKEEDASRTPVPQGRWGVSLAFSPDVNSVKNMHNGSLGTSMGMGVSYRLGKSLSVATGVYYSQKLYSADKKSYNVTEKPFATWTNYSKKIDADCRVIDIPVNLSLRISNKTSNKLSVSAGMSSYIMLSEKYEFVYNVSPAYPTGRREYTIRNENKHVLNIVNLAIALEKPVSDQVSLVIQPYAKLPLTGIGKGRTDLKSVGLGIGLNYSVKKKR